MRKLLVSLIFMFSFIVLSFADMVPIPNGNYLFESTDFEKVGFVINDYNMILISFEDGSKINLNLHVDGEGNYYYFFSDNYSDKWFMVFFDDNCYGAIVTSDSKYGNYSFDEIYSSITNSTVEQQGIYIIRNLHYLCK